MDAQIKRPLLLAACARVLLTWKQADACAECGASKVNLELDHILPKRQNGTESLSNLQLLCTICHRIKTAEEYGNNIRIKYKQAPPLERNLPTIDELFELLLGRKRTKKIGKKHEYDQKLCQKCGHEWLPILPTPVVCPRCHSPSWNRLGQMDESLAADSKITSVVL